MGVGFPRSSANTSKATSIYLQNFFDLGTASMQREFCYCHTFSTEGEIAGSAKIAPRYVIRDACPTSSDAPEEVRQDHVISNDC